MENILAGLTGFIDFFAMGISLWLAFYLFGKGYPNKIALRAVVVFLSLALFFYGAYDSQDHPTRWATDLRAIAITLTLATWYSLTYQMVIESATKRTRVYKIIVYTLGVLSALLLLVVSNAFIGIQNNALVVAQMRIGLPYIVYGGFLVLSGSGILYNMLAGKRVGLQREGRYFLTASIFACLGAAYGAIALGFTQPLPRIFLDLAAFASVVFLGIAVGRHQALIDRRVLLADVPVSAFSILGAALVYSVIVWKLGYGNRIVAGVMAFAVLTHSLHDLAREFLERARLHRESVLRKKIHRLEDGSDNNFNYRLKVGLGLLCQAIHASGGFVAVRRDDDLIVVANRQTSFQIGVHIPPALVGFDDITKINVHELPDIVWLAPVLEGLLQVAIIGIGKPKARMSYSSDDLELFGELTDQIGTLVSLNNLKSLQTPDTFTEGADLNESTNEMVLAISSNPDSEFVKVVEDGLRHLTDYIALGQSPLAEQLDVTAASHIERGKHLSAILMAGIEALRPIGERPPEPLPRLWYNYVVLHDAYVEGVPNREILARLYISEGTFNRTRRSATRGLARLLLEKSKSISQ